MLPPLMQERLERWRKSVKPVASATKLRISKQPNFVSRRNYGDEIPGEKHDSRDK